ncbi:preprotein translocase subunit YajC [Candidatus Endolissoclinum faulkneri]|nr:preprotein translocase subunit YajC [Candidatus Endolissoclinum faulkneri]
MLISTAYAHSFDGSIAYVIQILPLILIFAVFYFLLIRPQQKRIKQHKAMVANVHRGDQVISNGGLIGIVTKANITSDMLTVEIAHGVRVQILRSMLAEVRGRNELADVYPNKDEINARTTTKITEADSLSAMIDGNKI